MLLGMTQIDEAHTELTALTADEQHLAMLSREYAYGQLGLMVGRRRRERSRTGARPVSRSGRFLLFSFGG